MMRVGLFNCHCLSPWAACVQRIHGIPRRLPQYLPTGLMWVHVEAGTFCRRPGVVCTGFNQRKQSGSLWAEALQSASLLTSDGADLSKIRPAAFPRRCRDLIAATEGEAFYIFSTKHLEVKYYQLICNFQQSLPLNYKPGNVLIKNFSTNEGSARRVCHSRAPLCQKQPRFPHLFLPRHWSGFHQSFVLCLNENAASAHTFEPNKLGMKAPVITGKHQHVLLCGRQSVKTGKKGGFAKHRSLI